ncbi:MAG: V-type ATP synthase subunit E family protein [Bacteroidales bacterium]|nr:peptidylprolyl isomerase [Bacteroidales bacterium]
MESKLQELTNKLYNEGVEKANEEANKIVEDAKKEADKIKNEAQKEADEIISNARKESEDLKKNAKSEIELAAKQTLREVQKQITGMITMGVIKEPVKESMNDTEFIKELIETLIKNWSSPSGEQANLAVTIPENKKKELQDYLEKQAAQQLNAGIQVEISDRMRGGFSIGPADGSYKISFSEEDFENFFKSYLRPRTVEMLFSEKGKEEK